MKHLWLLFIAISGAFWEFAAWLTRTDFTDYVKNLEHVSPAWVDTATWTGGGCDVTEDAVLAAISKDESTATYMVALW